MAEEAKESSLKSVGIDRGLSDEVDRFMAQNPEFGIRFRSDFFNRAGEHFLRVLRREVLVRSASAAKESEGPLDGLRKLGVKFPDTEL